MKIAVSRITASLISLALLASASCLADSQGTSYERGFEDGLASGKVSGTLWTCSFSCEDLERSMTLHGDGHTKAMAYLQVIQRAEGICANSNQLRAPGTIRCSQLVSSD